MILKLSKTIIIHGQILRNVAANKNIVSTPIRLLTTQKTRRRTFDTLKLSLLGITTGAVVGTGYSIHKLNEARGHVPNEITPIPPVDHVPQIEPSRKIIIPFDSSGLKLTLFQYQTCPFCCKVRAFLDYYGISYDVVEVDPVLRQDIKWSAYKKVPILLAKTDQGYQQLNDSSMIISAISSYIIDKHQSLSEIVNYYPNITFLDENGRKSEIMNRYFLMFQGTIPKNRSNDEILEERKWRQWADEKLVHTLSPNVYRTPQEALQAFNWFSTAGEWDRLFPTWERVVMIYVGSFAMWMIGKRLKRRHNLQDDVRLALYDHCNYWTREIKRKGTPFMGGSEPNLADLAVYGVLNSIEGCDAFRDLLANTKISKWYYEMKDQVMNHKGHVVMV